MKQFRMTLWSKGLIVSLNFFRRWDDNCLLLWAEDSLAERHIACAGCGNRVGVIPILGGVSGDDICGC